MKALQFRFNVHFKGFSQFQDLAAAAAAADVLVRVMRLAAVAVHLPSSVQTHVFFFARLYQNMLSNVCLLFVYLFCSMAFSRIQINGRNHIISE